MAPTSQPDIQGTNLERVALEWLQHDVELPLGLRFEVHPEAAAALWDATARLQGLGFEDISFHVEVSSAMSPSHVLKHVLKQRERMPKVNALLVLPYLSDRTAEVLAREHISALDLCGNYQLIVPGRLLLHHLDEPNRYPNSSPIRDIWGGTSSLVPRVLLLKRRFDTQTELQERIEALGGSISKGTISKVLHVLENGLWVRRDDGVVLQHPDTMLNAFIENYRSPRTTRRQTVKLTAPPRDIDNNAPRVVWFAPEAFVIRATSGHLPQAYTDNLDQFISQPGVKATTRFADAEIIETQDPGVFFAPAEHNHKPIVSMLEVYLQLATGNKRDQDAAAQMRGDILKEVP